MRESLFVAREKIRNSLKSQQEFSEYTLRKRTFDTQRVRNEFEWQIMKVSMNIVNCKHKSIYILIDNIFSHFFYDEKE